jgi:hypothetical protein
MPSLFRYFVFVGGSLLGLIMLVNYMYAEPPVSPKAEPAKLVIEHDPRASLVERWRNEQDARKAVARGEPAPVFYHVPENLPIVAPSPTLPEPPQIVAPAALKSATADPDLEARQKAHAKAAAARKARIARERAERRRDELARQQEPFGFGWSRPTYAEAPRAASPFGWNWQ